MRIQYKLQNRRQGLSSAWQQRPAYLRRLDGFHPIGVRRRINWLAIVVWSIGIPVGVLVLWLLIVAGLSLGDL